QVFGSIRVQVRDPAALGVAAAEVTIKARDLDWVRTLNADTQGDVLVPAVPIGTYAVSVMAAGFEAATRDVTVLSNTVTPVVVRLTIAGVQEAVSVAGEM